MAKTILIPTDFRVASLNTLKLALECCKDEPARIVLMHAMHLSDSIVDLLFYSPHKIISSLHTPEFSEALEILKNRFQGGLQDLKIKLFHGRTNHAFNVFLKANAVDEIFIAKSYRLQKTRTTFDPLPFIKEAGLPVFEMDWKLNTSSAEHEQLITLFN